MMESTRAEMLFLLLFQRSKPRRVASQSPTSSQYRSYVESGHTRVPPAPKLRRKKTQSRISPSRGDLGQLTSGLGSHATFNTFFNSRARAHTVSGSRKQLRAAVTSFSVPSVAIQTLPQDIEFTVDINRRIQWIILPQTRGDTWLESALCCLLFVDAVVQNCVE